MSDSNLAKNIVSKLLSKKASDDDKKAAIEKQVPLDLFNNPTEEQSGVGIEPEAGSDDVDLFGLPKEQDKKDRDEAVLPEKPVNTDDSEKDDSDLKDLPQGEEADLNADSHYSGSGEGKKLSKGS